MEQKYCAPGKGIDKISCLDRKSLVKIIEAYNKTVKGKKKLTIGKKRKGVLWKQFREKMSDSCNKEVCWIDKGFVKKLGDPEISQYTFRPKMPDSWKEDRFTWLTTSDINYAMRQYERIYPKFLFIGPVAVDCPGGYLCELTGFDFSKLGKVTDVGIVYNLDPHYKGGSHWVALHVNKKQRSIDYYDSYGSPPPPEIDSFMKKIEKDMARGGIKMKRDYNKVRHQFGNSECGVFSMNFIIEKLKGHTLKYISQKPIDDEQMNEMRNYLYRNR